MDKIYVSFHIGRGGLFYNPGFLSFSGEENFQQLLARCGDKASLVNAIWNEEKQEEKTLNDNEWMLVDNCDNIILKGRKEIEAMTGRLEWDTIYDTDYVTSVDSLSSEEIEVVWNAYRSGEYMSEKLEDAVCSMKGFLRAHSIEIYPARLEIRTQNSSYSIDLDGLKGELTRDEWKEDLEDKWFCPFSVEEIIDKLETMDYLA